MAIELTTKSLPRSSCLTGFIFFMGNGIELPALGRSIRYSLYTSEFREQLTGKIAIDKGNNDSNLTRRFQNRKGLKTLLANALRKLVAP
jgi:hypothetical protein